MIAKARARCNCVSVSPRKGVTFAAIGDRLHGYRAAILHLMGDPCADESLVWHEDGLLVVGDDGLIAKTPDAF